jgi:metal-responsive CopG/Arc/MetJ family transcriptional regulator
VKIGVSLPDDLLAFADREARERNTSRSGLLAQLLRDEQVRRQARAYIDRHGWDVAEDDAAWGAYQQERMAREYPDDEW